MDPNTMLAALRSYSWEVRDYGRGEQLIDADQVDNFVDLFNALDNWLSSGGFLPADWQHEPSESMAKEDRRNES